MSARSQEWYSVEATAEKRRARMRRYQAALTELGARYVQQRQTAYQLARAAGALVLGRAVNRVPHRA